MAVDSAPNDQQHGVAVSQDTSTRSVKVDDKLITTIPFHVAIIMDGNGRWARQRSLPRTAGHRKGAITARNIVRDCVQRGISVLTLFAFSSENWRRPKTEIRILIELFMATLRLEMKSMIENDVRLRVIGDLSVFSEKFQMQVAKAEAATEHNRALTLQIATNYGGRWDIMQAMQKIAHDVQEGRLTVQMIDELTIANRLACASVRDPDLFIRTGGEKRLSNFLLWQSAYTELYFSDLMWPDFDLDAFADALADFSRRQRRFGFTSEQLTNKETHVES
jgi:undecaprenyl diphosphate synthase